MNPNDPHAERRPASEAPANLRWEQREFGSFAAAELYAVLRARVDVFVVEQDCPYPELDGRDAEAVHLVGWAEGGRVAAYARILPPGARFDGPSIGRVLTSAAFRGTGLGHALMKRAVGAAAGRYPGLDIELSAQRHLADFYAGLGFEVTSEPYDEDGIPHVDMRLASPASEASGRSGAASD